MKEIVELTTEERLSSIKEQNQELEETIIKLQKERQSSHDDERQAQEQNLRINKRK